MVDKKLLALMVDIAYKNNSSQINILPKGWKILFTSKEISNYEYKFQSVVFINKDEKQLVIADAGTRIGNYSFKESFADLTADYDIFAHNIPKKFSVSAIKFCNEVIKTLGADIIDYQFHCTGHSLGAVLAELTAVYLGMHYYPVKSVTFDSPGSKPLVMKLIKASGKEFDYSKLDIEIYNSNPNFINNLNDQIGQVFQILIDRDSAQAGTVSSYFSSLINSLPFSNYTIPSLHKQIDSHSLKNFTKCFNQSQNKLFAPFKLEDWHANINGARILTYDEELFKQLKNILKAEAKNNVTDDLIMFQTSEIEQETQDPSILVDVVTCDSNDILLARQFKLLTCQENADWIIVTGANLADSQ